MWMLLLSDGSPKAKHCQKTPWRSEVDYTPLPGV
jgi:hypothetical protein